MDKSKENFGKSNSILFEMKELIPIGSKLNIRHCKPAGPVTFSCGCPPKNRV